MIMYFRSTCIEGAREKPLFFSCVLGEKKERKENRKEQKGWKESVF